MVSLLFICQLSVYREYVIMCNHLHTEEVQASLSQTRTYQLTHQQLVFMSSDPTLQWTVSILHFITTTPQSDYSSSSV